MISASNMSLLPVVTFLVVLLGYGACCEIEGDIGKVTALPNDLLENFFCNSLKTTDLGPRFRRSTHPLYKRQADTVQQLVDRFGEDQINQLQETLSTFFNEDITNFADTMRNYGGFYLAEQRILKELLAEHGVRNICRVMTAIKSLREIDDVASAMKAYGENGGFNTLCGAAYRAYQTGTDGQLTCGSQLAYSALGGAVYCGA